MFERKQEPKKPEVVAAPVKPPEFYRVWVRCLNCGRKTYSNGQKGVPLDHKNIKTPCTVCSCAIGYERVNED